MGLSIRVAGLAALATLAAGCVSSGLSVSDVAGSSTSVAASEYRIGPGDQLQIYVWQNDELSVTVPVRPDGRISTPLVEDMAAVGKTPTQLAADIEGRLAEYIRTPEVSVIVLDFVGTFAEQIRVVGQAAAPQALAYQEGMTVLDVLIAVGGLTEFASGNRARLIRQEGGSTREIRLRLDDLLDGDIRQNLAMRPGDVLIVPGSFF